MNKPTWPQWSLLHPARRPYTPSHATSVAETFRRERERLERERRERERREAEERDA